MLVGLTGGVATGKSTVAKMFKRCGAVVIDADELAREVVKPHKQAWREIMRHFGKSVLNPDKTINRQALGRIVFHDRAKLRQLERIIHPRVAQLQARLTRRATRKNPKAVVIYDVPLLFEARIDKRVDKTIVVTADYETQIARLRHRNRLSRTEAIRRIRNQMPLAEKRHLANHVLDGTLRRKNLYNKIALLFKQIQAAS